MKIRFAAHECAPLVRSSLLLSDCARAHRGSGRDVRSIDPDHSIGMKLGCGTRLPSSQRQWAERRRSRAPPGRTFEYAKIPARMAVQHRRYQHCRKRAAENGSARPTALNPSQNANAFTSQWAMVQPSTRRKRHGLFNTLNPPLNRSRALFPRSSTVGETLRAKISYARTSCVGKYASR